MLLFRGNSGQEGVQHMLRKGAKVGVDFTYVVQTPN